MWLLPRVNVPVFIEFTGTLEILRQFDARNMAAVWKETSKVTTRVILLVRIILWSMYTQTTTACVFNKQYYY